MRITRRNTSSCLAGKAPGSTQCDTLRDRLFLNGTFHDDPGTCMRPNDLGPEVCNRSKPFVAIHARGVLLGDVRAENMIISAAYPAGPQIVFIDFALSCNIVDFPTRVDREVYNACFECGCCPEHWDPMYAWAQSTALPGGWICKP
ncbi:hypothetical protein PLICRDRAFT_373359 [Plicaturopsis crispa FD-325 SS-3]|uniref:Uncharacterized protein n=1 Tax=Plicaturopsis crispa FD-325 SS-3 TaxID=944288 RepID=A0A0C9SQZ2_PLICR|nr:hypothetical protein PLICRDRAFT_373359 [Plicaturopsis crispa FD-325 SS-3]